MPRKGHVPKREPIPDPVYSSTLVNKFVNSMMWVARRAPRRDFLQVADEPSREGRRRSPEVIQEAVENVKPLLEVKTRRVGGANYQVPIEVNPDRRTSLAIRWLLTYARGRAEKGMVDKLTNELLDAANGKALRSRRRKTCTHGRGQQGLRPLSLVVLRGRAEMQSFRRSLRNSMKSALAVPRA